MSTFEATNTQTGEKIIIKAGVVDAAYRLAAKHFFGKYWKTQDIQLARVED